jgi:hypothetical protein
MKKNRLGQRVKKRIGEEVSSAVTFTGLGAGLGLLMPASCEYHLLEGAKLGRHAGRTVDHMVRGTEGQRATESILEAELSPQVREQINMEGIALMKRTYDDNETFMRQGKRFYTLTEGAISEGAMAVRDTSDKLTGGTTTKVKRFWYDLLGDPNAPDKALDEKHELNVATREFNDSNEKAEKTTQELLGYIEKHGVKNLETTGVRKDIEDLANQLIRRYGVENENFKLQDHYSPVLTILNSIRGKVSDFKVGDLEKHAENVREYKGETDGIRESVESHSPISHYEDPSAWLQYAANPSALLGAVGLGAYFATFLLGRRIRAGIRKTTALPVITAYHGLKAAGKGIGKIVSKYCNRQETKNLNTTEGLNEDEPRNTA